MGFFNKYPYTDFHEMNLDWFLNQFKELVSNWEQFRTDVSAEWERVKGDWNALYTYVHDYFDNLDVQEEVNRKLDAMVMDGTLAEVLTPIVAKEIAVVNIEGYAALCREVIFEGVTYLSWSDAIEQAITDCQTSGRAIYFGNKTFYFDKTIKPAATTRFIGSNQLTTILQMIPGKSVNGISIEVNNSAFRMENITLKGDWNFWNGISHSQTGNGIVFTGAKEEVGKVCITNCTIEGWAENGILIPAGNFVLVLDKLELRRNYKYGLNNNEGTDNFYTNLAIYQNTAGGIYDRMGSGNKFTAIKVYQNGYCNYSATNRIYRNPNTIANTNAGIWGYLLVRETFEQMEVQENLYSGAVFSNCSRCRFVGTFNNNGYCKTQELNSDGTVNNTGVRDVQLYDLWLYTCHGFDVNGIFNDNGDLGMVYNTVRLNGDTDDRKCDYIRLEHSFGPTSNVNGNIATGSALAGQHIIITDVATPNIINPWYSYKKKDKEVMNNQYSYKATEDCYVFGDFNAVGSDGISKLTVDYTEVVTANVAKGRPSTSFMLPIRKNQTIRFETQGATNSGTGVLTLVPMYT